MSKTDLASYLFHQGTNFRAYEYLGCTLRIVDNEYEYTFRTWAPNAHSVGLVSDFSGWSNPIQFKRITENGIWELI
ncbi:MAG: 1,4-alpha-glucan branching enzyme, partial [Ruminococcaceae bacterium]|nr:1,4-alpha-glucan branching enzyme [Oscillospiraceae bacterium]